MQQWIQHIQSITRKSWAQFILFSSSLWLVFVHLEINRYIKDKIIGLHYWRKSDTLAQIYNYYYNGLNFFDHSIYFNQLETAGQAVAEFPLFYYFVAIQQSIFGPHEIIAKVNWIILLFFGLFSLFKICNHFLKHFLLSLFTALSLFISPVFVFYAIDFLPDPVALNFTFIGLWLLLKSITSEKRIHLILSLAVLSIAGMTKPFFFIPFLAFIVITLVNQFLLKKDFPKFKIAYLLPIGCIIAWFLYTNWYNTSVDTDYFLSKPRPIWNYSKAEISVTWHAIYSKWMDVYITPGVLIPFLVLLVLNLAWWTKETLLHNLYYLTCIIGSLFFIVAFFNMFEHHDYYVFPILFLIPLTFGLTILKLTKRIKKTGFPTSLSIASILFLILTLNTVWSINQARRKAPHLNSTYVFENYENLDHFLNTNGVTSDKYVMAFSDKSPTFALSLMQRKGWSGFQTMTYKKSLQTYINKGASYLIINSRENIFYDSTCISGFMNYPLADTNDIFLYDLKPYQ